MNRNFLPILVAVSILSGPLCEPSSALGASVSVAKNWMFEPSIREIRKIVNNIEASKSKDSQCEQLEDIFAERTIYTDSLGRVRELRLEYGSEHSSIEGDYYYDTNGINRFTFERVGLGRGNVTGYRETRSYYDGSGKMIHQDIRHRGDFEVAVQTRLNAQEKDPKAAYSNFCRKLNRNPVSRQTTHKK